MLALAGPPPAGTPVPPPIAALAGHDPVELVWRNETGGVTARIDRAGRALYAKWSPAGSGESLEAEAARMRWLASAGGVPVPDVVALERRAAGELLVTAAVDAVSIVSAAGLRDPEAAAAALGEGLRLLHAVDVRACPFPAPDWTASAADGVPPRDSVICHGDPCAPNTLIAGRRFAALVDLGRVGRGDRWSDLAIASWSLAWNGLEDAEPAFWAAYGVEPDEARIASWRARWEPPELDDPLPS